MVLPTLLLLYRLLQILDQLLLFGWRQAVFSQRAHGDLCGLIALHSLVFVLLLTV